MYCFLKSCHLFVFEVDWDSGSELSDEEADDIEEKECCALVDPHSKESIQAETCSVENSLCKVSDANLKQEIVDSSTSSDGHLEKSENKESGKRKKKNKNHCTCLL